MTTFEKLTYSDFILLNDDRAFHPGGLTSTLNIIAQTPNIDREKVILDFGCGSGITLAFLQKLGFRNLIGYDCNPNAINASRSKHGTISFSKDLGEVLQAFPKIDLLLLESVFAFNDKDDLASMLKSIQLIAEKTHLKYIGIIDVWTNQPICVQSRRNLACTFGIKKVRSMKEFRSILQEFRPLLNVIYLDHKPVNFNYGKQFLVSEQLERLLSNNQYASQFESTANAKAFLSNFIDRLSSTHKLIEQHLEYFECLISIE